VGARSHGCSQCLLQRDNRAKLLCQVASVLSSRIAKCVLADGSKRGTLTVQLLKAMRSTPSEVGIGGCWTRKGWLG
jgi:hypothetical protein